MADRPPLLAAFLDLREAPVLVVGGGEVAARKAHAMQRCGAHVTLVAPSLAPSLAQAVLRGSMAHRARAFEPGDVSGVRLAVAATDDREVNRAVAHAARALAIPVNVADEGEDSTLFMAASVARGPVQIAISTSGTSPALARRLRASIEDAIPQGYAALATLAGRYRTAAKRRLPDPDARRRFWERVMEGPIAALAIAGREGEAREALERALDEAAAPATQLGEE